MILDEYQLAAVEELHNGALLCGGVGSGKSRTAIAYYYVQEGGQVAPKLRPLKKKPTDLYIITTAQKRDTLEWDKELLLFGLGSSSYYYENKIVIDSWNNIKKYSSIKDSFFIFDEHHAIGSGSWTKSFLQIAKNNKWILLTATPGDTWIEYAPVFIANGFYKNKTEFCREHVVFKRIHTFYKVDRYMNTRKLERLRNKILVDIKTPRRTIQQHEMVWCDYDKATYHDIFKNRWNYSKNEPIQNASELCYELRKCVNSDISRLSNVIDILAKHRRVIIFYNFDYELDILKTNDYGEGVEIAEWNGHKHQPIPDSKYWVYLVQYTAGSEGWNCTSTDCIIFYSMNYSYKIMIQAAGRIDRRNTPFNNLYYYHIKSRSPIDSAIAKALNNKKQFNAERFINGRS